MIHSELESWKKSIDLAVVTYKFTAQLPDSERFGLKQQIQRSAVSVPSNIAEGCGRQSKKELNHFLGIALGSLIELETQIILVEKIFNLTDVNLNNELVTVRKLLIGFRKYVRQQINAVNPESGQH